MLALPACCGHARHLSCRLWRYRHGSKKGHNPPIFPPFRVKTTPTKIRSHTPTVFAEFVLTREKSEKPSIFKAFRSFATIYLTANSSVFSYNVAIVFATKRATFGSTLHQPPCGGRWRFYKKTTEGECVCIHLASLEQTHAFSLSHLRCQLPPQGAFLTLAFPLGKVGFEVYPRRSDEVVIIYCFLPHPSFSRCSPDTFPKGKAKYICRKRKPRGTSLGAFGIIKYRI